MVLKATPNEDVVKLLSAVMNKGTVFKVPYVTVDKDAFLKISPPTTDIPKDENEIKWAVTGFDQKYLIAAGAILSAKKITNSIVYPPSSMMDWHTNSDLEGIRTYYTYTEGEGIFRYVDSNGNIQLDYDNTGWTCRTFKIQKDKPLWHSIWTEKQRYAFGFMT